MPVDGASVAVIRITVGAVLAASMIRLAWLGRLESLYAAPTNHLRYPGLEWIPVPTPGGVVALAAAVGIAGVALAFGWRTRVSAVVAAVGFFWFETIEVTTYLNHYWFLTLMTVLLALIPAGAVWSLDAHAGRTARHVPAGAVWLLRAQVLVVYTFAGVAKLHPDWLVEALPLSLWLPARAGLPVLGPLIDLPGAALVASWAGAVFDLTVGWLLMWGRTRRVAFVGVVAFHLITWALFPIIGVFPLVMISSATVFFEPHWPRRTPTPVPATESSSGQTVTWVLVVWVLVQVALPLRHLVHEGDARWTGEGYRFAWNVMAMEKAGHVVFRVEADDVVIRVDGAELFTPSQLRVARTEPALILQMAHAVAASVPGPDRRVFAEAVVSVNGRPATVLIDPTVDLASIPLDTSVAAYTLPPP